MWQCHLGPGILASGTVLFMLPAVCRPHLQTPSPAVCNVPTGRGRTHAPWVEAGLGSRPALGPGKVTDSDSMSVNESRA